MSKTKLPTVEQTKVLASALARKLAHQPADVDDLVQEGLLSWHYRVKRKPAPRKPFALARTVMQRAMFTYYRGRWCRSGARYREDVGLDFAPTEKVTQEPGQQWDDAINLNMYLTSLEVNLGTRARFVAENMIMPRDLFYCRALDTTATRERRKHLTPTKQELCHVAGLDRKQWVVLLEQIREFTALWLLQTQEMCELPPKVRRALPLRYRQNSIESEV